MTELAQAIASSVLDPTWQTVRLSGDFSQPYCAELVMTYFGRDGQRQAVFPPDEAALLLMKLFRRQETLPASSQWVSVTLTLTQEDPRDIDVDYKFTYADQH